MEEGSWWRRWRRSSGRRRNGIGRTRCGRMGPGRRTVRWERRASGGPRRGGGPDAASSWARTRRPSTRRCLRCGRHSGRWNERDREYTIFVDSTSAITRVRDDARGPGQRFGVAAIEVETRLAAAGNTVTIRWVPAHAGAEGNEVADQYAKDAALAEPLERGCQEGYAEETSLAHMTRVATEARSKATTDWITEHVRPGRRYRPLLGRASDAPS